MKYRPFFFWLSIALSAALIFSLVRLVNLEIEHNNETRVNLNREQNQTLHGDSGVVQAEPNPQGELTQEVSEPWRDGESVVKAFQRAYPDRVRETAFRENSLGYMDWALLVNNTWFYYAEGRMLPDSALADAENYNAYSFYRYEPDLPELRDFSREEIAAIEERVDEQGTSGIGRHPGLTDNLWDIYDYQSSDRKVKTIYLFRRQANVHRSLLEDLAGIEERLYERAETDAELSTYLASIGSITGHNWRQIDGTSSRSLHSYGIAIDIIPARYSRDQVYWRWARQLGLPWYNLPYDERMMPPMSFVHEFEQAGFIWGGKWRSFDTIHFEYRPEIIELNKNAWSIEAVATSETD